VSLYLLDTDHFPLYQNGHPHPLRRLAAHAHDRFGLGITTVEETIAGWQHAARQARDDQGRVNASFRMARAVSGPLLRRLDGLSVRHNRLVGLGERLSSEAGVLIVQRYGWPQVLTRQ
jgi:hypothetical protein